MRPLEIVVAGLLCAGALARGEPPTAAQEAIPFSAMTESNRAVVQAVTDHPTLRREYAAREFPATAAILEWLLDHLQATWALARAVGLPARTTTLNERGEMWTDDGDGSKGFVVAMHQAAGKRVYYMEGSQQRVCTVRGRGVIVVDYVASGSNTMQCSGAQFIRVDHAVMAALTQLFRPFLTGMVDAAYQELLEPLRALCTLALTDPAKLREVIQAQPAEDRQQWEGLERLLPAAPPPPR